MKVKNTVTVYYYTYKNAIISLLGHWIQLTSTYHMSIGKSLHYDDSQFHRAALEPALLAYLMLNLVCPNTCMLEDLMAIISEAVMWLLSGLQ